MTDITNNVVDLDALINKAKLNNPEAAAALVATVAAEWSEITALTASAKELKATASATCVTIYARIISWRITENVKPGSQAVRWVYAALEAAGVSAAARKRFVEQSHKARKLACLKGCTSTEEVEAAFAEAGITSQAKLLAAIAGPDKRTLAERIVEAALRLVPLAEAADALREAATLAEKLALEAEQAEALEAEQAEALGKAA
jgi:hypothetical protein